MSRKNATKAKKRKSLSSRPFSTDAKKTVQQFFLQGDDEPNPNTIYTYKLIGAFISNIEDMLSYQISSSSIAFMHSYKQPNIEDFPSIKHSNNYIKSFKRCLERIQESTFFTVDESEYLQWSSTESISNCSVDLSDIPSDNFWIFFDLAKLNIHKLYLEGINEEINNIGAYIANFKIHENKISLQIFKYLGSMTSWYQTPYTLELPLSFIKDRIKGNNIECTLNVLFDDMTLPSDDDLEYEIKLWCDLIIFSLCRIQKQEEISKFKATNKVFTSSKKTFANDLPTYSYTILQHSSINKTLTEKNMPDIIPV